MEQKQEKQKQAAKPEFAFGEERWGSYKKDVRKDKTYFREGSMSVSFYMNEKHREIELFTFQQGGRRQYGWSFVKEEVARQLEAEGYTKAKGFALMFGSGWNSFHKIESHPGCGYQHEVTFIVTRRFVADKPSQIVSDEEAFQGMRAKQLADDLPRYIENAIAKVAEHMAAAERARLGNIICNHYADIVRSRAKKAVRWSQRLAALEAEFKAEVETQAVELLTELGDDKLGFEFEDGFQPDPRSVVAAKEHLPKVAAEMKAPTRRSMFPRSLTEDQGPVTAEDVK